MSTNRRSFLKNTTAATGGLILPWLNGFAAAGALNDDVARAVAQNSCCSYWLRWHRRPRQLGRYPHDQYKKCGDKSTL
jgi:hypothetical protein